MADEPQTILPAGGTVMDVQGPRGGASNDASVTPDSGAPVILPPAEESFQPESKTPVVVIGDDSPSTPTDTNVATPASSGAAAFGSAAAMPMTDTPPIDTPDASVAPTATPAMPTEPTPSPEVMTAPAPESAPVTDAVVETAPGEAEPAETPGVVNPMAAPTHHKPKRHKAVIILAVVIGLGLMAGAAYFYMQYRATSTPTTKATNTAVNTETTKATSSDVTTTTSSIDSSVQQIDDTKDFTSSDLSSTTLGL